MILLPQLSSPGSHPHAWLVVTPSFQWTRSGVKGTGMQVLTKCSERRMLAILSENHTHPMLTRFHRLWESQKKKKATPNSVNWVCFILSLKEFSLEMRTGRQGLQGQGNVDPSWSDEGKEPEGCFSLPLTWGLLAL